MTHETIQIILAFSIGFAGAFAFRYGIYPLMLWVERHLPHQTPEPTSHHHHPRR